MWEIFLRISPPLQGKFLGMLNCIIPKYPRFPLREVCLIIANDAITNQGRMINMRRLSNVGQLAYAAQQR
jgi:hypothetical protein